MNQQSELYRTEPPPLPAAEPATERTVTEARQAVAPNIVRYVLGIGLLLAVVALGALLIWSP